MIVGVDFDNTIVCYDELFHRVAVERSLVPAEVPRTKPAIREHLRRGGRENQWTELQGIVYGPRLREAAPFPGVLEFFSRAVRSEVPVQIVSHKTRLPVIGVAHDLHQAARDWLVQQGFFDPNRIGMSVDNVCFCTTREEKIQRIKTLGCTVFIDDLEEVFREPSFPGGVERILFAPETTTSLPDVRTLKSWKQISDHVLGTDH